jgi:hypothetical protein
MKNVNKCLRKEKEQSRMDTGNIGHNTHKQKNNTEDKKNMSNTVTDLANKNSDESRYRKM